MGGGMRSGDQLPGTRGIDMAREALDTARGDKATAIPERAFQQQVLDLARLCGWRAYHAFDSRRSEPGFPDVVLVRGDRLIFAELKSRNGRVRAEQWDWLGDLGAVERVETHLWRPDDFDSIEEALKR